MVNSTKYYLGILFSLNKGSTLPGDIKIMFHYTYLVEFKPTNQIYYGVRSSNDLPHDDLWCKYFTSSKTIKKLINEHGKDSFTVQIRKVFKTRTLANRCEERVLRKFNVTHNQIFLNLAINSNDCFINSSRNAGNQHSLETKRKISDSRKGQRHSKETKEYMSNVMTLQRNSPQWREHMSRIASQTKSESHKRKISEKLKNIDKPSLRVVSCPHCSKTGALMIMKRWHFEQCKQIGGE